jgi:hypothetical protein
MPFCAVSTRDDPGIFLVVLDSDDIRGRSDAKDDVRVNVVEILSLILPLVEFTDDLEEMLAKSCIDSNRRRPLAFSTLFATWYLSLGPADR